MLSFSGVSFVLFCFFTTLCVLFLFLFLLFVCLFGDVSFSECFCIITVFSLYGKYVVRFFFPDGVFLPCAEFLRSAYYVRIQSTNQSKATSRSSSDFGEFKQFPSPFFKVQ